MPFIQPRLSSKTVEDIWTQAGSEKHPEEGCTRCWCGSKYWDGDICHSCGEKWDGHDSTDDWESQRAPHTAKAKVFKSHDGKSWGVACNTNECRSVRAMEGLTHDGASQLADSHNRAHHSKTSADVNYGGGPGSDDPGINLNYVDMGHEPKSDRLGTDATCDICGKAILFDGFHGPMERDEYGHSSPSKSWKHVVRASAHEAFTHDEIDWTDIEPGSPECASLRPSDREETMRIVRKEDERRKTPRDTPDRRQSSTVVGYSTDKELEGLCAACKGPLNSFSKTVDGKRYCSQTCAESKTSTRRTAIDTMTGKRPEDPLYGHGAGENSKLFRVDYTHRDYTSGQQVPATLYVKAYDAFGAEVKAHTHGKNYLMHIIGTEPKATEVPEGQQSFFGGRKTAIDNWDAIMQSPELKAVWSQVRSLASQVISAHQPQDEDGAIYGISSSDINHTVFSYAQRHWNGTTLNVGGLIHDLMDEADNSW